MAEKHRRLGKGLGSIFGSTVGEDTEGRDDIITINAVPEKIETKSEKDNKTQEETTAAATPVPSSAVEVKEGKDSEAEMVQMISLALIQPNLQQPRKDFQEDSLQELAASIKTHGVFTPILVRKQGALYEIVAGERRWRAAKKAGLTEMPAIIADYDEKTAKEVAIIENIQRSDLNAVEEAMAYQSLMEEYGMTQEELAQRLAKKRSTIANSLRLLKLQPEILDLLKEGRISQGHGRALLSISDPAERENLAKRCVEEDLSVREAEKLAKQLLSGEKLKPKPKGKKEENLTALRKSYRELERKMEENLGTKVSILPKDTQKGKLEIQYFSQEELDRLFLILRSASNNF